MPFCLLRRNLKTVSSAKHLKKLFPIRFSIFGVVEMKGWVWGGEYSSILDWKYAAFIFLYTKPKNSPHASWMHQSNVIPRTEKQTRSSLGSCDHAGCLETLDGRWEKKLFPCHKMKVVWIAYLSSSFSPFPIPHTHLGLKTFILYCMASTSL